MVPDVQSFCRAGTVLGVCDLVRKFEGILLGRGLAILTQVFIGTGGGFLSVFHQVLDTARRLARRGSSVTRMSGTARVLGTGSISTARQS